MNRALYICGIVLSVAFLFTSAYYANEVSMARSEEIFGAYGSFNFTSIDAGYSEDLTVEGSIVAALFFAVFIFIDVMGLIRVKRRTTKVMSIIGIGFTAVFLVWDFMMMSSPGPLSFDEVGIAFCLFSFPLLAFNIVGLIQSIRFAKRGSVTVSKTNSDLLDS